MDADAIEQMIAALTAEEDSLTAAAKNIEVRLAQVRSARIALAPLVQAPVPQFEGNLADACRHILKNNSARSFSPKEIRDQLVVIGYDASKHENPMAAIHSVLKRLAEGDDVDSKQAKDGSGTRYFWKKKPETAPKKAPTPMGLDTAAAIGAFSAGYQDTLRQLADFYSSGAFADITKTVKEFQEGDTFRELRKAVEEIERFKGKLPHDPLK